MINSFFLDRPALHWTIRNTHIIAILHSAADFEVADGRYGSAYYSTMHDGWRVSMYGPDDREIEGTGNGVYSSRLECVYAVERMTR